MLQNTSSVAFYNRLFSLSFPSFCCRTQQREIVLRMLSLRTFFLVSHIFIFIAVP